MGVALGSGRLFRVGERIFGRNPSKITLKVIPENCTRVMVRPVEGQTISQIYLELEIYQNGRWITVSGTRLLAIPLIRFKNSNFPSGGQLEPRTKAPHKKGYVWRIVVFKDFPTNRLLALHVPENVDMQKVYRFYGLHVSRDILGIQNVEM